MFVTKKKYRSLEMMKEKDKSDYLGIMGEMRQEAKKDRVSLEAERVGIDAINQLNEDLDKKDYSIIGVEINRFRVPVAVVSSRDHQPANIMLYSLRNDTYQGIDNQPKLVISFNASDRELVIEDVLPIEEETKSGNGSILVTYLIKEARRYQCQMIKGTIKATCKEEFEKIAEFYEKNGFSVVYGEKKGEFDIELIL
ncbi:hypothetical protein [Vagococcus hydrophili]|uniref:N-acetyltransferase domain-containing protein n=1 Tax=Vagococcus hydrophili TaxID=2714947 RepID=A0A6G8AUC7_9ENTE|nr:hypothetical protein [Vagococcus hydrophili]QIL48552.1 hypothetical protein G7082_08585 [Vagococcus hydrophili]